MADIQVYSVQPKFYQQDNTSIWSHVDNLMTSGANIPAYGSQMRDYFLSRSWMDEPVLAGAFSTWVEKVQTLNWKVIGSRNNAIKYANLLNDADGGKGWSYHAGVSAIQYLTTDKGCFIELGRDALTEDLLESYNKLTEAIAGGEVNLLYSNQATKLVKNLHDKLSFGTVKGIQHLDSTRMINVGLPYFDWRYYPAQAKPISYPNENLIQIVSNPSPLDDYKGFGMSALSRIYEQKELMLGYITYFRQEIGDIPPELAIIINGLPDTYVADALAKYKQDKENKGHDRYGKIWWLGSDDPSMPVSMNVQSMTTPNKAFNYQAMVEWWVKTIALNTGESVGEYWLIQHSGATKAVESIQALKAQGKGVARYIQEHERMLNQRVLPNGVRFLYDNTDDTQDAARQEILGSKIGNLAAIAAIGVDRQKPAYSIEQIQALAKEWGIVSDESLDSETPTVVSTYLKEMSEGGVSIDRWGRMQEIKPILSGRQKEQARQTYEIIKEMYSPEISHQKLDDATR